MVVVNKAQSATLRAVEWLLWRTMDSANDLQKGHSYTSVVQRIASRQHLAIEYSIHNKSVCGGGIPYMMVHIQPITLPQGCGYLTENSRKYSLCYCILIKQ